MESTEKRKRATKREREREGERERDGRLNATRERYALAKARNSLA